MPDSSLPILKSIDRFGDLAADQPEVPVPLVPSHTGFNRLATVQGILTLELDVRYTSVETQAFSMHPDATQPELGHLIGRRAELVRLAGLAFRAGQTLHGGVVFLTGEPGMGKKALGRTLVDALRRGGEGTAVVGRFWPDRIFEYTRRDPRWSLDLAAHADALEANPVFLQQPEFAPLQAMLIQALVQKHILPDAITWPSSPGEIPDFIRSLASPGRPLVVLLEDFENAPQPWLDLLEMMAREAQDSLPVLFVVVVDSARRPDQIPPAERLGAHELALRLCAAHQAEIYHLGPISLKSTQDYLSPAPPDLVENVYHLGGGIPLLVENLWKYWQNNGDLVQGETGDWCLSAESIWQECGSGMAYVQRILDELWPMDDEAPWPASRMLEMLAAASLEGQVFTLEALSAAFEVAPDQLREALDYLLDEPDDPGLVTEASPESQVVYPAGRIRRTLHQYRFQPLVAWQALRVSGLADQRIATRLAEGLQSLFWPLVERPARVLARLFAQANQPEIAGYYRRMLPPADLISSHLAMIQVLAPQAGDPPTRSRLLELMHETGNAGYALLNPTAAEQTFIQMLHLAEVAQNDFYRISAFIQLGRVAQMSGKLDQAVGYYQQSLEMSQALGMEDGAAASLSGLGQMAFSKGAYENAHGYYQKALAIFLRQGWVLGQAAVLKDLGDVQLGFGKPLEAIEQYQAALDLNRELGIVDMAARLLMLQGDAAQTAGLAEKAEAYYHEAEEAAREQGVTQVMQLVAERLDRLRRV